MAAVSLQCPKCGELDVEVVTLRYTWDAYGDGYRCRRCGFQEEWEHLMYESPEQEAWRVAIEQRWRRAGG